MLVRVGRVDSVGVARVPGAYSLIGVRGNPCRRRRSRTYLYGVVRDWGDKCFGDQGRVVKRPLKKCIYQSPTKNPRPISRDTCVEKRAYTHVPQSVFHYLKNRRPVSVTTVGSVYAWLFSAVVFSAFMTGEKPDVFSHRSHS